MTSYQASQEASEDSPSLFHINFSIRHFPFKRIFDIIFSLSVLLCGLPIYFILACLVTISSKGPIFYGHKRVGRGAKVFSCWKFRSMYKDADERLHKILEENPQLKDEWIHSQKLKNDPRITPIGKFLRKTSLDELPQFWNVLKGDLSVVGPRAMVQEEIERHLGIYAREILSVRPGITGLWQVSGRNKLSYSKRVALDLHYARRRKFANDLQIIAKTIPVMIFSKGAY